MQRQPLTVAQVLAWADDYHRSTGKWPSVRSGPIPGAGGESWWTVDSALRGGRRGLPQTSLTQLLTEHRGPLPHRRGGPLTMERILAWADAHHARTGAWPAANSGPVVEVPGEDWRKIHVALTKGFRGLPGGSSLSQLLAKERGVRPGSRRAHASPEP
jgi:hypothetical protein